MATIRKRGGKFIVIYRDDKLKTKTQQKWETFDTYESANKRKIEVEYEMLNRQKKLEQVEPKDITVRELLHDYIEIYGLSKWALTTYSSTKSLIANYIDPLIGDKKLPQITSKFVDQFYRDLQKMDYVETGQHKRNAGKKIGPPMLFQIHKVLRSAFNRALRWEYIPKNPFEKAILPEYVTEKKAIWKADDIANALAMCDNIRLLIAINLAFACSMRAGEIIGLQWNQVNVSEKSIAEGDSWLYIDRELLRVDVKALKALDQKDVLYVFPHLLPGSKTRLVLKTPKTRSSIRKVWIPKTVAELILRWKREQEQLKEDIGDCFVDYGLVLTQDNGRPLQNYRQLFEDFKKKHNLPDVVFHSLRHSSTTYKLKLNNGDIKATQGDTGHSQAEMVTRVYAHILDEDRKVNAEKFEAAFYSPKENAPDIDSLLNLLENNPELAGQLRARLTGSVLAEDSKKS
jgi:integrase